jgi:hypothetical protein
MPNQPFAAIWSIRLRGISAFWGSSSRNWKHDILGKRAGLNLQFDTCSGSPGRLQIGRLRL